MAYASSWFVTQQENQTRNSELFGTKIPYKRFNIYHLIGINSLEMYWAELSRNRIIAFFKNLLW